MKTANPLVLTFSDEQATTVLSKLVAPLQTQIEELREKLDRLMNQERQLSIKDTCAYLGVSRQTLMLWTKQGLIKSKKIGGRVFYLRSEIEESLKR